MVRFRIYACKNWINFWELVYFSAERWHPLRRYFNKAFTLSNLKTFVGIFDKNSRALTNRIEEHAGNGDFELMDYVLLTALTNVCGKLSLLLPTNLNQEETIWIELNWIGSKFILILATSIGLEFETEEKNMLIVKAFQQFHNYVIKQMLELQHWFSFISPFFPLYWRKRHLNKLINKYLMEVSTQSNLNILKVQLKLYFQLMFSWWIRNKAPEVTLWTTTMLKLKKKACIETQKYSLTRYWS